MDDDGKDWWQEESKSEKVESTLNTRTVVVGVQDTDTYCVYTRYLVEDSLHM